ncbi:MAG: glutamine-hydrolyzing GMP synthase [Bryobacteraceae bacterium]|nr:glutamine-hydrolyzing GMP synthase [Bryobacteraceae bacterium]
MTEQHVRPQVAVLDTGGQYCHLIARRIREQGVYAEVASADTPVDKLAGLKGVVISGGPASVYEAGSPTVDPNLFSAGVPALGICYGMHLMAHLGGGAVRRGDRGEFGLALLDIDEPGPLFAGLEPRQQIWMSHRDAVEAVPPGFHAMAHTDTCAVAAMGDPARRLYGLQFHPEVVHTRRGAQILSNFLFEVCRCSRDWNPARQIPTIEDAIRRSVGDRGVLFFLSGGIDSAVAYTLCIRALGPDRVHGVYVDTGLMREGETEFVSTLFSSLAAGSFDVEHAAEEFLTALAGVRDPERKRNIIGEKFVEVQERILERGHYLDGHWILGQGTIYPDTIESGGTAHADLIKTHHNRVAGIQRLIEANRIVEPLTSFYKDEVRELGRTLGLPETLLERHPFPGPALAIRCLCVDAAEPVQPAEDGWVLPVRSVGVQGDSRSYRPVLALERVPTPEEDLHDLATRLINRTANINRVVAVVRCRAPLSELRTCPSDLSAERLERLRRADAVVRKLAHDSGFDRSIWQFPVVLIPVGAAGRPDSIVLRPVDSVDGMTANSVLMPRPLLDAMAGAILDIDGIAGVFYDLTHKPPATIEWE